MGLDENRNMLSYFWINFPERPAAVTYMKEQIVLACQKGRNAQGFRHLGAGLHILEDYFAHSNFTEIAIMKVYDPEVFPRYRTNPFVWTQ